MPGEAAGWWPATMVWLTPMPKYTPRQIRELADVDISPRCCHDDASHLGLCIPKGMQREVLLCRLHCELPEGMGVRYAETFFGGPNPTTCPDDPGRCHILLEKTFLSVEFSVKTGDI
jgi:hypothetical protein